MAVLAPDRLFRSALGQQYEAKSLTPKSHMPEEGCPDLNFVEGRREALDVERGDLEPFQQKAR